MADNVDFEMRQQIADADPYFRPAMREIMTLFASAKLHVNTSLENNPKAMPAFSALFLNEQLEKMQQITGEAEIFGTAIDAVGEMQLYAVMEYQQFHDKKAKNAMRTDIAGVDKNLEAAKKKVQSWARETILKEPMLTLSGILWMFEAIEIKDLCQKYGKLPVLNWGTSYMGKATKMDHNVAILDILTEFREYKRVLEKHLSKIEVSDTIKAARLIIQEEFLTEKGKLEALRIVNMDDSRTAYLEIYSKYGNNEKVERKLAAYRMMVKWFDRNTQGIIHNVFVS